MDWGQRLSEEARELRFDVAYRDPVWRRYIAHVVVKCVNPKAGFHHSEIEDAVSDAWVEVCDKWWRVCAQRNRLAFAGGIARVRTQRFLRDWRGMDRKADAYNRHGWRQRGIIEKFCVGYNWDGVSDDVLPALYTRGRELEPPRAAVLREALLSARRFEDARYVIAGDPPPIHPRKRGYVSLNGQVAYAGRVGR